MDLRKRRSVQLLWKALFELMTEKRMLFSKVTVDQICEKAMVHRSTFYKHFDDKFRLLEYGLNQLMKRYFDCMTTYSMRLLKKDALKFIERSKTIDIPHDLLAEFHVSAMFTLSAWWRKDPNRVSLVQLDQYFHRLVKANIFKTLPVR